MSGYFSALMRSMGPVPVGRAASPVALEVAGHDEVAAPFLRAPAPSEAGPAPASALAIPDVPPVPPADAAPLPPFATRPSATVVATAPPSPGLPADEGVVAAAIRWVATGDAAPSVAVDAAPAALAEDEAMPRPVIVGDGSSETAAERLEAAPAAARVSDADSCSDDGPPAATVARVTERVRPDATPTGEVPTPERETFEVTIGAIHLRVDAPPPQVVARAAPPATARAPAPRSGLARRALRGI